MFRNSLVGATLMLIALTVIVTWPQALHLATAVPDHDDPYLSMWRIGWLSHALLRDPRHLFDANIFSPHTRTLAFGDATLLEGMMAAPWLWAQANLVAVYNVLLLAGIVSSGVGMFLLVRYLTNDADAALVSAAIFTLAPYRIEHFMHLELQWTVWMPLTLWAIHRVFDEPSIRRGVVVGALLALQVLSSLYYGLFLGMIAGVLIVMLAVRDPRRGRAALVPLCAGLLIAAGVLVVYSIPYLENARVVGTRDRAETANYSAQIGSYFSAPLQNWLWGWTSFWYEGNELHLFPTITAVLLAIVAVVTAGGRYLVWVYLALAALAFDLSLGLNGLIYRWLYAHIWVFQGFRAPARFAIVFLCALAVLGGFGFVYLKRRFAAPRLALTVVLVAVGLESGAAPLRLTEVPRREPDLYTFIKNSTDTTGRPVMIELPMESGFNSLYMFWSTRHWHSLVNGYSGFIPRDYEETVKIMRTFPDDRSIARLRRYNVRRIVVHDSYYLAGERTALMLAMAQRADLIPAGKYRDWIGMAQIFELKPLDDQARQK